MTEVWMQELGTPDSKRGRLLYTDHLDMREVARAFQYGTLSLQLSSQRMTAIPLDAANALWPLVDLRRLTGHAGTRTDPFLFSGQRSQGGVLSMGSLFCHWPVHLSMDSVDLESAGSQI